jgi:hypothetical protein
VKLSSVGIEPTTHGFSVHVPAAASNDSGDGSESVKNGLPAGLPPNLLSDPELKAVVDAWPTLPPALRAGIAAMVQAAKQ